MNLTCRINFPPLLLSGIVFVALLFGLACVEGQSPNFYFLASFSSPSCLGSLASKAAPFGGGLRPQGRLYRRCDKAPVKHKRDGPECHKMGLGSPKMVQDRSKRCKIDPRCSKMSSTWARLAPRLLKIAPKFTKMATRWLQEAPNMATWGHLGVILGSS